MKKFTEEEKIQYLADLIAIKSVNENEIEVADYLKKLFAEYDIDSEIVPVTDTRVYLDAEIGSGSPVIGISGHMDVVSAGDEKEWTSDPFTPASLAVIFPELGVYVTSATAQILLVALGTAFISAFLSEKVYNKFGRNGLGDRKG